ncbi:AAA family ATPase [Piscinibacter sakaiensis]|uniref:AAA family ATPase n=1 Tax=Piscinibacter sakaiensis TaxID=1547922 RepID=UPI003AAC039E
MPEAAMVVALVGAESTGKSTLAAALQQQLIADGLRVAVVGETLREFCDQHRRTPRIDEQALIAQTQTNRIADAAAAGHDIVIADTTALMIAVYSELVFGDTSLYASAEAAQARCDLTLLTALDLPWIADGLQRDGPHVREPVDRLLRGALQRTGVAYSIVAGSGQQRIDAALAAVRRAWTLRQRSDEDTAQPRWQWVCDRCGDAGCERHWLLRARGDAG